MVDDANPKRVVWEAGRVELNYWGDLWSYRELLWVLAWRDVAVRYKQTVVGVLWAWVQPLMTMGVFTVVFGRLAGMPSQGTANYFLLVLCGMLPWTLFSSALTGASQSLVQNSVLVSKVYFPRVLIPLGAMAVAVVDFMVSLVLLLFGMGWMGGVWGWRLLTLPLWAAGALLAALGPGLLLASLTARYRDFRYVVPFILQVGVYLSPVGYGMGVVCERFGGEWVRWYALNPMVSVIEGFRWAVLGTDLQVDASCMLVSGVVVLSSAWVGIRHFRGTERGIADVI